MEAEEFFPIADLPPPVMVEILRFVLADEKELRLAAVPSVSSDWRSRTMEYLATVGQQLGPRHRFLMLRHVAVFRSIDWKILSSLPRDAFREILKGIRANMSSESVKLPGRTSVFLLLTRGDGPDLGIGIENVRDRFDMIYVSTKTYEETFFFVSKSGVFPHYRVPPLTLGESVHLNFFVGEKFRAQLTAAVRAPSGNVEPAIIQRYDVALHVANLPRVVESPRTAKERFFENIRRKVRGGVSIIGFEDSLSKMLIVSTRARITARALGTRKRGEEDVKERGKIAGGGEYVYSTETEGDEGVFVALGNAILPHATSVDFETYEEAGPLGLGPFPEALNRREYVSFEFPLEDSNVEKAILFLETTGVFLFRSATEARSAIPYDRIFFSNGIPLEDLERLFMLQRIDIPGKAPGEAKMKGGEVCEF